MFQALFTTSEKMVKFLQPQRKGHFLKSMSEKGSQISNEKSEKRVTFSSIGMGMVYALTLD